MKIIIAGSRHITEMEYLIVAIRNTQFKIKEVVCGCAKGVDTLGKQWAEENNIPVEEFPPDFERYPIPRAFFARNIEMAHYADGLIAVWDGSSTGTMHMIQVMTNLKKPVEIAIPNTILEAVRNAEEHGPH